MEDKLDKFLMWRRIAEEVEDVGYDGAVFVTEAWSASPEKVTSPYAILEHVPGRTEHLNVSAQASRDDGLSLMVNFIDVLDAL